MVVGVCQWDCFFLSAHNPGEHSFVNRMCLTFETLPETCFILSGNAYAKRILTTQLCFRCECFAGVEHISTDAIIYAWKFVTPKFIQVWTGLLKTLDTFGNCQRPIFSLGVSKITNLWKFELNWSSKMQDNKERKTTLVTRSCLLSDAWFRNLKI